MLCRLENGMKGRAYSFHTESRGDYNQLRSTPRSLVLQYVGRQERRERQHVRCVDFGVNVLITNIKSLATSIVILIVTLLLSF